MVSSAEEIGRRIAEARGRAGLTQVELAAAVELGRPALTKIETGVQRVSAQVLARIADALGMRIEWFVDDAPAPIISRRNAQEPGAPSPQIDSVVERISRAVEFVVENNERWRLAGNQNHTMPNNAAESEQLAAVARRQLGADGLGPIMHLDRLTATIGLLVFTIDLGIDTADAATILLPAGGVSVVNGARHVGRRRLALAHEIGHYLVADEYTVDWRVAEYQDADIRENLFDRFARALLLPADSVRKEWDDQLVGNDGGMRPTAIRIASRYRVDMTTLARRLIDLEILSWSEAKTVRAFRTKQSDIVEMDLVVGEELNPPTLPVDFERAVLQLYRSETISSARAIDLLLDTWSEEDLPDLPNRTENEIWQFV
jgi:Zn-dependent peptidase ImmA (M78 family)/transcriptional regulator with XRE-family HTH domain